MIETVLSLIGDNQPWWFWALAALLPLCALLFVREFLCWFWKINHALRRLDRLEKRISGLQLGTEDVSPKKRSPVSPAVSSVQKASE